MLKIDFAFLELNYRRMVSRNGTLEEYTCSKEGLLLPFINEFTWPTEVRAFLYLMGLFYCFMGVAIIADIFMGAIEKITSTTRKVTTNNNISAVMPSGSEHRNRLTFPNIIVFL